MVQILIIIVSGGGGRTEFLVESICKPNEYQGRWEVAIKIIRKENKGGGNDCNVVLYTVVEYCIYDKF